MATSASRCLRTLLPSIIPGMGFVTAPAPPSSSRDAPAYSHAAAPGIGRQARTREPKSDYSRRRYNLPFWVWRTNTARLLDLDKDLCEDREPERSPGLLHRRRCAHPIWEAGGRGSSDRTRQRSTKNSSPHSATWDAPWVRYVGRDRSRAATECALSYLYRLRLCC